MDKKNKQKRTAGDIIRTIIIIVALAVFLFSVTQLAKIFMEYKKGTDEYDRVREYVATPVPQEEPQEPVEEEETKPIPPQVDWVNLKAINGDIIGWIQIEGTEISYPIVKGTDNSYYLKHTFEKNTNAAGAIFMDYTNSSDFQDCNTLIYGHNMKNGTMFHDLVNYKEESYFRQHQNIIIYTPEKEIRLRPIAVVCI